MIHFYFSVQFSWHRSGMQHAQASPQRLHSRKYESRDKCNGRKLCNSPTARNYSQTHCPNGIRNLAANGIRQEDARTPKPFVISRAVAPQSKGIFFIGNVGRFSVSTPVESQAATSMVAFLAATKRFDQLVQLKWQCETDTNVRWFGCVAKMRWCLLRIKMWKTARQEQSKSQQKNAIINKLADICLLDPPHWFLVKSAFMSCQFG